MRDVLDNEIAELYPVRGGDDARLARLREQLFAEQPKRRSRTWIPVAAVAVAVAMITGLVVLLNPASRDSAATTRATSLLEAAALLEVVDQPPPGRYLHIRYSISQTKTPGREEGKEVDAWVPAAPGETVLVHLKDANGQRTLDSLVPPDLLMPVEPMASNSSCEPRPCLPGTAPNAPQTEPMRLVGAWWQLMSPYPANGEKAALYRELAATPGVRWDNGTVSVDGDQTSLRIDTATGRIIGTVRAPLGNNPVQTVSVTYEWTDQRPS